MEQQRHNDGPSFQEATAAHEAVRAIAHLMSGNCPLWSLQPDTYCEADRVHCDWINLFMDHLHHIVYPFASDLLTEP